MFEKIFYVMRVLCGILLIIALLIGLFCVGYLIFNPAEDVSAAQSITIPYEASSPNTQWR